MKQMTSEVKQQQLGWRRAQVLELASAGYTQREIASKLQVDLAAVNRDIHFLRKQAQDNLEHHIRQTLPEEYQRCMIGMKRNLKQTLEIAETTTDPKVKLQARAIANDCYKYIMDLTTNGTIISDSITYVKAKTNQLKSKPEPKPEIKQDNDPEQSELDINPDQPTHNSIF